MRFVPKNICILDECLRNAANILLKSNASEKDIESIFGMIIEADKKISFYESFREDVFDKCKKLNSNIENFNSNIK